MTTKEPPPEVSALLSLDSEPIPLLNLDGELVTFKDDPLADAAWAELVGLQNSLKDADPTDADLVANLVADMKRILGAFIVDGKTDWDNSDKLGLKNLTKVLTAYVQEVSAGLPT